MVWETTLTIRTSNHARFEKHVNAAEARRSLLAFVRKNDFRINGNGQRGILLARGGPNSLVSGTYDIA